jgi:hypothetical protein
MQHRKKKTIAITICLSVTVFVIFSFQFYRNKRQFVKVCKKCEDLHFALEEYRYLPKLIFIQINKPHSNTVSD